MRALRLFTVFWVAFGVTALASVAAARSVPPWVKVAAALPDLLAKSLGL